MATDPEQTAADVEARYLDLVAAVRESISIPLAVKIGPYFSSLPNMAWRLWGPGPTAWSCSTASSSPTSTWRPSRWPRTWS